MLKAVFPGMNITATLCLVENIEYKLPFEVLVETPRENQFVGGERDTVRIETTIWEQMNLYHDSNCDSVSTNPSTRRVGEGRLAQ